VCFNHANSITISGFDSQFWGLNGGATIGGVPPSSDLILTEDVHDEARSAFFFAPLNISTFSARFRFILKLGGGNCDGFTFTVHNDPRGKRAVGFGGAALGYCDYDGFGPKSIIRSASIQFGLCFYYGPGIN